MRSMLAVILITYLVGVRLILWPTAQSKWSVVPASDLSASIDQQLPYVLSWPVKSFTSLRRPVVGIVPPFLNPCPLRVNRSCLGLNGFGTGASSTAKPAC